MIRKFFLLLAAAALLASCQQSTAERDLASRQSELQQPELFAIFDSTLTSAERDALTFLYAYMPLPDITDNDGAFFLSNVDCSLRAREEMPWGKRVPEREWRHFVLPLRVNNEPLDSSRIVFYRELKPRVANLTMAEAILEVNHWCHEHATYQPSDGRTSSPLQTVKSAIGRCGEESTFAVAALRSVGIPARQVYTPRWAHTDDNHAWVEAWADGEWYLLGACEPEPVLNLAWFNQPASRRLLMHTTVFGKYDGPEDKVSVSKCYTEINVTENYAPVALNVVRVVDTLGKPVKDAELSFCIYNYAEFYPVLTTHTDANGIACLRSGKGDMVAWAISDGQYGFTVCSAASPDTALLTLNHRSGERYHAELFITPPPARNTLPEVSPEAREQCNERLAKEDSIRNAYIQTFDTSTPLLAASRGNHDIIKTFLAEAEDPAFAAAIVQHLWAKDKRDITLCNLLDMYDHGRLSACSIALSEEDKQAYVVQQRVMTEALTPYRGALLQAIPDSLQQLFRSDVRQIAEWTRTHIRIDNSWNPQHLKMAPISVWRYRVTDNVSRDIFFVALARTFHHPAEVNPITGRVRYLTEDGWAEPRFSDASTAVGDGIKDANDIGAEQPLTLLSEASDGDSYRYYSHFSICRLNALAPRQLEYPEDATLAEMQANKPMLAPGDYLLITGSRLANGAVMVNIEAFPVTDAPVSVPFNLRQSTDQVMVIGSFNSENRYQPYAPASGMVGEQKSLLSTTGRGYFICGAIAPNNEPSTHMLHDLEAARREINKQEIAIVLLFESLESARKFRFEEFPNLPDNCYFGIADAAVITELCGANKSQAIPTIVIADTFNRVVFSRTGYTIGLGDQLLDCLKRL